MKNSSIEKKRVCVESWLTAGLLKLENYEAKLYKLKVELFAP
jgi:hypothetical protein